MAGCNPDTVTFRRTADVVNVDPLAMAGCNPDTVTATLPAWEYRQHEGSEAVRTYPKWVRKIKLAALYGGGGCFGLFVILVIVALVTSDNEKADSSSAPESPTATATAPESPSVVASGRAGATGADPGARDDNDKTPLHKAARNNANPAVIAALIEAGADPGARDAYDNTPLHDAASDNSNPAVIVALIEGGADPNARDKYNEMPLHVAAHNAMFAGLSGAEPVAAEDANRWPSVIKALIEGGADSGARNERGATPFDFATDVLFNAAASYLMRRQAEPLPK